mgnify:CR=1 FL=1
MAYTLASAHQRDAAYWGERPDWIIAAEINRDSRTLDRSNFRSMERLLEAVDARERGEDDEPAVAIERSSHWAVGWIDRLVVRPGSAAATEAMRLHAKLDDYPVLDEEDWSELECDAAADFWQAASVSERIYWCKRYRLSIFAARRAYVPEDDTGELMSALAE